MLDVRRLRIFIATVEEGSFTAAAQRLYLTQSAVSKQISILEREFGVALFVRAAHGVSVTPSGEVLARRTRSLLAEMASIEREVRELGQPHPHVTVGAFMSAAMELLPQAIRTFMADYPSVGVSLIRMIAGDPVPLLREHQLDVMLTWDYGFEPPHEIDGTLAQLRLPDDPLQVVLPIGHRLASAADVALAELANEKWIVMSHNPPHAEDLYERMLEMAGFEPEIAFRAKDYQSLQGLVAAGIGVSMAPRMSISTSRSDVVVRPISAPILTRRITALALPPELQSKPVADFLRILRHTATYVAGSSPLPRTVGQDHAPDPIG